MHKIERSVIVELVLVVHNKHQPLKGLEVNDNNSNTVLVVHIIFVVNDYTKIKMKKKTRVTLEDKPIAKLTKLEWVVLSPGSSI